MKSRVYNHLIIIQLLLCCTFNPIEGLQRPKSCSSKPSLQKTSSRWDKYLERIFNEADENHDGSISFEEVYERVLLFYIELNRKAPIAPPSKQRVKQFYDSADWSHNKRLDSDEFQALASTLAARGYTRLLAYRIVTIVVAPIVANYVVNLCSSLPQFARVRTQFSEFVYKYVPDKFVPTISSMEFWKTAVTVLAVMQLGNLVLYIVNRCLDMRGPVILSRHKKKHAEKGKNDEKSTKHYYHL